MPKVSEDITSFLEEQGELYLVVQVVGSEPRTELCNRQALTDRLTKYFAEGGLVKYLGVCKITHANPPRLDVVDMEILQTMYKDHRSKLEQHLV